MAKDFDKVRVQDHHVIVERKEDGLYVTEIVIFQNDANTAFLGVGVNHASPSGMRVGLPASVEDFKPGLGLDEPSVTLQGRELTSRRPILSGAASPLVHLPGAALGPHGPLPPALLPDATDHRPPRRSQPAESTQLTSGGTREQGGKTYAMYRGNDLPVGAEVAIRIGGAGFFSNPKVYPLRRRS